MGRGVRLAVAVPAVVALVVLSAWLVPLGVADWRYQSIRGDLRAWALAGRAPTAKAWEEARGVLESALALAPGNPFLLESLGRLHLTEPSLALSPRMAATNIVSALSLRPTAPYPWIMLLIARIRMGFTGAVVEKPLVAIWRLGPMEPGMQVIAADLGLASWNEMGTAGRAVVAEAVALGMRRNPVEMLTISQRRGRLFPACAHVQGDVRLAQSQWSKVCDDARPG